MNSLRIVAFLTAFLSPLVAAAYEEQVTFTIKSNEISFGGELKTVHLMLDRAGGRNRVADARAMTRQADENGARVFRITITLQEGDYIYVFVANVTDFVTLTDPGLNPDDVPDSNFFLDPSPDFPGFGGQYSSDNIYFVRDPNRPTFNPASPMPRYGALVTSNAINFSVEAMAGADQRALAMPVAEVQMGEPVGVRYQNPPITQDAPWAPLSNVQFSYNAQTRRGTLTATWMDPLEGFHLVRFKVSNDQALQSDWFTTSVFVNRMNQPPIGTAGPQRFTSVNKEVVLNGGQSVDPDWLGFQSWNWRVIDGPGGANVTFRDVDDEPEPGQRDGFGKPYVDEHGNHAGNTLAQRGAIPRFKADRAGVYRIGMTATDIGGAQSTEAETEVIVVPSFNPAIRVRLEPYEDAGDVVIDASLSQGPHNNQLAIYPDHRNPAAVNPTVSGLRARFPKPATAGFYLFHVMLGGNSHYRSVMMHVRGDGGVFLQDYGTPPRKWVEDKVMYLGFVREFYDSNADGEGDFLGMIDKMAHIQSLGVNAMWIMPVVEGPTTHGYAATEQFGTEQDFGTLEEYELLIETAHAFGIEVLMDLVANHTSAEHPFFIQAKADPGSATRSLFSFDANGNYRYAFNFVALPDMNSINPLVRKIIVDMVRFWMERGVDGVRADIAGFTGLTTWEDVRYEIKQRNPEGIALAELIPPQAEFFDQRFDLAYDSDTFHSMRDSLAGSGNLDNVDSALERASTFFSRAASPRIREALEQKDLLWMRYLDNQDEDRFLLRAGNDLRRSRVGASVLMTLPGVPLVYYGDEAGIAELRGRMPFGAFSPGAQAMVDLYKKLILMRRHNWALRSHDNGGEGSAANTYIRINNNGDPGGGSVYSYVRFAGAQRFIVLANRNDSTVLGTTVRFYPPPAIFTAFPDGQLKLVDHLDPADQRSITKADLLSGSGATAAVRGFTTKIYQVTRFGIPDADRDGVLDSYDRCVGVANPAQADTDSDDVGNECDLCAMTPVGTVVNTSGCPIQSGQPRHTYTLDGVLEDPAYRVAENAGKSLYASFNGHTLYLATEAANPGEDVVIVVSDTQGTTRAAPLSKAGQVVFNGRFMADEGENDVTDWTGATGQARSATHPIPGRGHLEGTLNILEEFGSVPSALRIAVLHYATANGGALQSQVPAATTADGNVTEDELFVFQLIAPATPDAGVPPDAGQPEDAGNTGTPDAAVTITDDAGVPLDASMQPRPDAARPMVTDGDTDGDGLTDDRDNCVNAPNESQSDFDVDGVGDACDECPISRPSDVVDSAGCASGPERLDGGTAPRPEPRLTEDPVPKPPPPQNPLCGCSSSQNDDGMPALAALCLGVLGLRLRRGRAR